MQRSKSLTAFRKGTNMCRNVHSVPHHGILLTTLKPSKHPRTPSAACICLFRPTKPISCSAVLQSCGHHHTQTSPHHTSKGKEVASKQRGNGRGQGANLAWGEGGGVDWVAVMGGVLKPSGGEACRAAGEALFTSAH